MGILEPITHQEEIDELLKDAQQKYDDAVKKLDNQKKRTSNSLERLGLQKLNAWSGDMRKYLSVFERFNNIQMICKSDGLYHYAGEFEKPQELMVNMQQASLTATEVLQVGTLSIGAGALIGIASYGGAMMFAHASTGTAIASLSGAAKSNATLAWFGGGSLKAGGMGKIGGKIVLAGIVIAPILLVAGAITAAKSKEKLEEAKKIHAEAENAVSQMEVIISSMEGIEKMADNYQCFLDKMSVLITPFIDEMDRISKNFVPGSDGKINYDELSDIEQKTLHLSWLIAQLYYHCLSVTILTSDGTVAIEAQNVLAISQKEYATISSDVNKLNNEKVVIYL